MITIKPDNMIVPALQDFYEHDLRSLSDVKHPPNPIITTEEVLKAHYAIVSDYCRQGRTIGMVGIKNKGELISAVMKPYAGYDGYSLYKDNYEKAASIFYGIARNHAFNDANKRTALVTLLLILYNMGRIPDVNQKDLHFLAIKTAENKLHEHPKYKRKFNESEVPGVAFIAFYLRNNTRNIDRSKPTITFHELKRILSHHSFQIEGPKDNKIKVFREIEVQERLLGLIPYGKRTELKFIKSYSCRAMSTEVPDGIIREIRKDLRLDEDNGVDSRAFYKDEEPLSRLIVDYHGVLMRLANK